jgi:hypothetical protein
MATTMYKPVEALPTLKDILKLSAPKVYKGHEKSLLIGEATQLVGVEIEVENIERSSDWYVGVLPAWNVTTDNSLRGSSLEFVSRPMPLAAMLYEIQYFYARTGFTDNNFSDRCSIHVHANVQDMTIEQVSALFLLYQTVEDVIFSFIGHDRDTNLYCIPWSQCLIGRSLIENMLYSPSSATRNWQKYTALNLLPIHSYGTVEFRHMHGTPDVNKVTNWLNIINRMMCIAKETPIKELLDTILSLNTSSQYEQFFHKVFGTFLEYTPAYRETLSLGVINSKYALGNAKFGEPTKAAEKKKAINKVLDGLAVRNQEHPTWEEPHPAAILRMRPVEEIDRLIRGFHEGFQEGGHRVPQDTPQPQEAPLESVPTPVLARGLDF